MSKKKDLIDAISLETGLMKSAIGDVLDAMARITEARLKRFEPVEIPGIVALKVMPRAEREGRNPRTGETIRLPSMNAVKARPVAALRAV